MIENGKEVKQWKWSTKRTKKIYKSPDSNMWDPNMSLTNILNTKLCVDDSEKSEVIEIVQDVKSPEKQNGDDSNMSVTNNANIFATMETILECTNTRELHTQLDVNVSINENEFQPPNHKNDYIHFDFDSNHCVIKSMDCFNNEMRITQEWLNDIIVQDASYQNKVNNTYNSPEKQIKLVNEENASHQEKKVRKRKSIGKIINNDMVTSAGITKAKSLEKNIQILQMHQMEREVQEIKNDLKAFNHENINNSFNFCKARSSGENIQILEIPQKKRKVQEIKNDTIEDESEADSEDDIGQNLKNFNNYIEHLKDKFPFNDYEFIAEEPTFLKRHQVAHHGKHQVIIEQNSMNNKILAVNKSVEIITLEDSSEKSVEIITLDDSSDGVITIEESDEDMHLEKSSDEYITADEADTIKLICHKCGKKIDLKIDCNTLGSAFEGFIHQIEEHHNEFKTNMPKDFDDFHLAKVIVDDNTDYYDRNLFLDNKKDIGLYIVTTESKELSQWKKLGIYEFSDRKYFKKYLNWIASIFINLKSNFEIIPKIIKLPQITLVDIGNV